MIFGHSGVKSHNKPWKYGIPILRQLHLVGLLMQDGPEMMISQQLHYGEAILHGAMDPPLTNREICGVFIPFLRCGKYESSTQNH